MSEEWNIQKSTDLYGIEYWGDKYFGINQKGHVEVQSTDEDLKLDLYELIRDLRERGIRVPMLLRFTNIVRARIKLIKNCFDHAIKEYNYQGTYAGAYPIKVNQQKHMLDEIVSIGADFDLGLECGSKPELLIALASLKGPNSFIICNGFKDLEYIETALLSQKLGHRTFIVIDRFEELALVLKISALLDIVPHIGLRARLSSRSSGKWSDSSGARSKFGLTPTEIVRSINILKEQNKLSCLELLHFHTGSQISSIQSIKGIIKEGGRFYTELCALGAHLKYIDVGGGLGVDYDGSGTSQSSTNYSEQEYANDVVSMIQSICDEKGVPHPNIISESGRSLVAHSSVLIFDVLGKNNIRDSSINIQQCDKDSLLVKDLWEIYINVSKANVNEFYNDLVEKKRDTQNLFNYGVLSLEQRAKAEDLYWATASKILELTQDDCDSSDIYWELEKKLADLYFCNFSIFQSLPDSWAINQVFPVIPIHRLETRPDSRATLVDLTCDSDGKLSQFIDIDEGTPQKYLEVHDLKKGEPYYIGVFLTGAYQETLGDLHNLFGDTDAVHITLHASGYNVDEVVRGDSVTEVLGYVQYERSALLEKIRQSCETGIQTESISRAEARMLLNHCERGLDGYTYLET